jgi:hypothetical protein
VGGIEDNLKGDTAAFATFSPFKKWWGRFWEQVVFKCAPSANQAVREREFLHYAFFVNVTPRQLARAGISGARSLRHGALLFISAYNGDPEIYFRGFSDKLYYNMNKLWEGCEDWQDAKNYRNLELFIRSYRRPVNVFFNGYAESAKGIRRALRVRTQLDELIAAAHSPTDGPEFAKKFEHVVQVIWGNPS